MRLTMLPALLLVLAATYPARGAQSYDNCSGFIDSVPAVVTTQGVWCLRADLATALTSGSAITVATNNVTIDCNGFKLGGLAAGPGTEAKGITALSRLNVTVRDCNIRGFSYGVEIVAGSGHVLEDTRLDGITYIAALMVADASTVRRNAIIDTGGSSFFTVGAYAIVANGVAVDIIDNAIHGVQGSGPDAFAHGILMGGGTDGSIRGNRVRGLVPNGAGESHGIQLGAASRTIVRDNDLQGPTAAGSVGIRCLSNAATAYNNVVSRFEQGIVACAQSGNFVNSN